MKPTARQIIADVLRGPLPLHDSPEDHADRILRALAVARCGAPDTPAGDLEILRLTAERTLDYMRCPHYGSEYGNCSDCMNFGYEIHSQQEQDLVTGCELVVKAVSAMHREDST